MNKKSQTAGILAEFENPQALIDAARKFRDEGYTDFDCHSPFPIHGMDEAMGEERSHLGWIVGGMGFIGCAGAILLQWWTSAVDYPLIISGKPFFSLPAFIPITFELTILLAAFGAVFGMLQLNHLPRLNHPVFESERFEGVTDDKFFLSVMSDDEKFNEEIITQLLESLGSNYIEILPESGENNAEPETAETSTD